MSASLRRTVAAKASTQVSSAKRAPSCGDTITILQTVPGKLATKHFELVDGVAVRHDYNAGLHFAPFDTVLINDIFELSAVLTELEGMPNCLVIRGSPRDPAFTKTWVRRTGSHGTGNFETPPEGHHWVLIDFDEIDVPAHISLNSDPVEVCEYLVSLLPPEFHESCYHWTLSSKAGMGHDSSKVSMHIWFWLSRPARDAELKTWAKTVNSRFDVPLVDDALFQDVQAHYTAAPIFEGVTNPFPKRSGLVTKANTSVDLICGLTTTAPLQLPLPGSNLRNQIANDGDGIGRGPVLTSDHKNDTTPVSPIWTSDELLAPCGDGDRTANTLKLAGTLLARRFHVDQVIELCLMKNERNTPPLAPEKVVAICRSLAVSDARNHPDRDRSGTLSYLQESAPPTPLFDLSQARIDHFLSTPPPPRRWVLDGVLPLGIVAAIVSPGGMGKSQLLMQLGYSVATGIRFAGHWQVGEAGAVLMLCAEDDIDEIHRRINRIHSQLGGGLSNAAKKELADRLFVRSMVGEEVLMTLVGKNNEAIRTILVDRLALTAKQAADIKLIVIDPASRFRGGDENSNQHATRFVQVLEYLAQTTGATVLIAHHVSKASTYGDEASAQASRGASALSDGIRLQLALTPLAAKSKLGASMSNDERRRHLEVSVVKTNYTAPQAPVLLRRENDGYLSAVAGSAGNTSPRALLMLELLRLIFKPPFTLTARQIEQNMCGPGKALPISQKELRSLIQEARDAGWLVGARGKALTPTNAGRDLLIANKAISAAEGAARRRAAMPHAAQTT